MKGALLGALPIGQAAQLSVSVKNDKNDFSHWFDEDILAEWNVGGVAAAQSAIQVVDILVCES